MTAEPRPSVAAVTQPKRVLRVVEVTRYLKQLIEKDALLALVQVHGEVTNLSRPGSGHLYFSLKDEQSQLRCVMMRSQASNQLAETSGLKQGVSILAEGTFSVYEPRGDYQMMVRRIKLQGEGAARLRFEQLRKKLESEGLFSEARKRALPKFPRKLVVITAPDSQAYHDVIKRWAWQWPRITAIVAGVAVQGEQAAGQIATALDIANRLTGADAILIVRGGGSPEELDAFNDERLARAIFASRLPVLTGIGHTQDLTIADLVADQYSTTPTAAAAVAVPDGRAMVSACNQIYRSIQSHMAAGLRSRRHRLGRTEEDLIRCSPRQRIDARRQRLDELLVGLERLTSSELTHRQRRLAAIQTQLNALDPQGVLARGYALLTDSATGEVISSAAGGQPGRQLKARVKDGSFTVTVGHDN